MNGIDKLIAGGIVNRIRDAILPKETYYVGPSGISGSVQDFTSEFKKAISELAQAIPEGTRLVAWFCRPSDGGAVHGQITVDNGQKTPAVVWNLRPATCDIDYLSERDITFPTASDKLMACANPMHTLTLVPDSSAEATIAMIRALGYEPRLAMTASHTMRFRKIGLVNANA